MTHQDYVQLLVLALQLIIAPIVFRLHGMLWGFNARLVRLETRAGIHQEPQT